MSLSPISVYVRKCLPCKNWARLIRAKVIVSLARGNLEKLGRFYGSDKVSGHYYALPYQSHFEKIRKRNMKVLEIGIGGYDDPLKGGESLRMWKAYFPNSIIYGIDICDKKKIEEDRIVTFQGSQDDNIFLDEVVGKIGQLDIIIDDGSHLNEHVKGAFERLFPALKEGGIYVVEDTQTSYWDNVLGIDWGGSTDLNAAHTTMNYFKRRIDGLNHQEFIDNAYLPTYFDTNIVSMHFYHNLIFIYKGKHDEPSNLFGKKDVAEIA